MADTLRQRAGSAELRFRAMGSDAHLIVVGGDAGLVERARQRVDELEQRWSRFIETSEISRLNRAGGAFVHVSADTVALIERAKDGWRLSGGAFDPTVLGAMLGAGYDRSFDLLESGDPAASVTAGRPVPAPAPGVGADNASHDRCPTASLGAGVEDVVVDGTAVRLPVGTGFDPGGIGKGLAADLVCEEMMQAGAEGACINLGGDVRVAGAAPGGEPWTVDLEHPEVAHPFARLGLWAGAVATSTTLRRRWMIDGSARHHLIDPQTGLPSETDLTYVTVIAAQAWAAEVLTKAVLLAGSEHPFDILGGTGAQAVVVDRSARIQATAGLVEFLGDARLPASLR
jgi:thiamine biosynthesis lipoprotein